MKNYHCKTLVVSLLTLITVACTDSLVDSESYKANIKYSSKISNLRGEVGIERVELNWENPVDQVAKKIRIEYGDNLFIETDTLVSTYTIDLGFGGNIEFTVYTLDAYGNKSVGTSIFLTPFSSSVVESFVESVTPVRPASRVEEESLTIRWDNLTNHDFLRYTGIMDYTYTINNEVFTGVANSNNSNEERVVIPDISSPTIIDFEYTMYYWPIINNIFVMDTISKTEKIKISIEHPDDNILEKIDHSICEQVTNIPFDNTTQHSDFYNFYNMFDGNINTTWISSRPDTDPVNGGNAQNNYTYPLSFTIDLGKEILLSALEFSGWEDYSQAPKKFDIWGTNEFRADLPEMYWTTTIPGEWLNDWQKLASCDTNIFNSPSIKYEINPDQLKVRFVRFLVHEIHKIEVQPGVVSIRIAIGDLILYRKPGMVTRITY